MSTIVTATVLARDAQEFIVFKRAMGTRYQRGEFVVNAFLRFVAQRWGKHGEVSLDEAVIHWISRNVGDRKAVTVGNEFGVVRQLCLYRRRYDPSSYVPEHTLAPIKESIFLPYIYTHDEVRQLLAAGSAHKGRFVWGGMLRALILLLYCTGLRLGEAVRLRIADTDLVHGTLMIQHSKGRSRMVAIRTDLVDELQHYVAKRRALIARSRCADPSALFLRLDATPLTIRSASEALRRLLRELGMKPLRGRVGARPYELRHAFAVHRLTQWAVDGVDVQAKLPWLSAYLGHQNVIGTEVYLKATPQLLELASDRFEEHLRCSRRPR